MPLDMIICKLSFHLLKLNQIYTQLTTETCADVLFKSFVYNFEKFQHDDISPKKDNKPCTIKSRWNFYFHEKLRRDESV